MSPSDLSATSPDSLVRIGNITGTWILDSSRNYQVSLNPDPPWVLVDSPTLVTIEFKDDSLFGYSNNYHWKYDSFDRYKMNDTVNFSIYSTARLTNFNIPNQALSGKVLSDHEIELTYFGIDHGTQEKYSLKK